MIEISGILAECYMARFLTAFRTLNIMRRRHHPMVESLLLDRHRLMVANVEPTLIQRLVSAGKPVEFARHHLPIVRDWREQHGSTSEMGSIAKAVVFYAGGQCESQYCGEPPWPRGSVLGLRPPELEFRILCLEDSVISIISPSSGGSPGPV